MRKKFDLLTALCSLGFGLAGGIVMCLLPAASSDDPMSRVWWMAGAMLVVYIMGFVGMQVGICCNQNFQIQRPKGWLISFLLSGALIFGIAAGGQYLFMYSKEEVTTSSEVDMVLLLDTSSSMYDYGFDEPRNDAAKAFVNALDESCQLQAISFGGTVIDVSDLIEMDDDGKEEIEKFVDAIDSAGTTNFDNPLMTALDTLTGSNVREDSNKAVILLTDGEAPISDTTIEAYEDEPDITVFSVRIPFYDDDYPLVAELIDFVEDTGGTDTALIPESDGSVDTDEMLEAFLSAYEATTDTVVSMSTDYLIYSDAPTFSQVVIRTVCFLLFGLLFAFGYFGGFSLGTIGSVVCGLVAAVLISLLGYNTGMEINFALVVLLLGTAYVSLDLSGGGEFDV